jgi:(R,R)-butanediol dehydrogenase / meso-butanediol dehydrogenase / diacetyl reductase
MMRALRWHARGDVRVDEVARPRRDDGQVLVAVELCGICGSDVAEATAGPHEIPVDAPHALSGRSAPITLGHEVVGTVVEAPPGSAWSPGDRVLPDVVVGCGRCWWCARHEPGLCERLAVLGLHDDGGLAELMVAAADTCVRVPERVGPEVAVFAEPTSVAVRAVRKVDDLVGAVVVVVGAGAIGLLTVQAAFAAGAAEVLAVDPVPARRSLAADLGAGVARPEDAEALVGDRGADAVFECSGAPGAIGAALALLRRGGSLVCVGIPPATESVDLPAAILAEQRILGSAAHVWDEDVRAAMSMLARGVIQVDGLPVRRVALEEAARVLLEPPADVVKVVVDPSSRG